MKRIYTLSLILIFLGAIYTSVEAQSKDTLSNAINWEVVGSVDATHINLSDLNKSLVQSGISPVNSTFIFPAMLTLYMGPVSTSEPFTFSFGFGAGQETQQNAEYASKLTMAIWMLSYHYNLWHSKRSIISAGLGFGYTGFKLHLYNFSQTPSSFNAALSDMQGERVIRTNNNNFINPSLSYKWAIYKDQSFWVGVHAGYRIGINRKHWQLKSGVGLSGAPTTSANGFYTGIDLFIQ